MPAFEGSELLAGNTPGTMALRWLLGFRMKFHLRKYILILFGVLFVLFGIAAFFGWPGAHEEGHHTRGHNLTHILIGVVVLIVSCVSSALTRRRLCFIMSALYLAVALLGAATARESLLVVPGLIEFHLEDTWVQVTAALLFLGLGLLKPFPTTRRVHALGT